MSLRPLSAESAAHTDLRAADGATARVYHDGAQVATWTPAGETVSRLFVSGHARFGDGQCIRGGIPVIFPQFGTTGPLRAHGFARWHRWTLIDVVSGADGTRGRWRLTDAPATRAEWPGEFTAELSVQVGGAALTVGLAITNTGRAPFTFTAALHPYLAVADAYACEVVGLMGTRYRDALEGDRAPDVLHDALDVALPITGALDRVYFDTAPLLELRERGRTLRLEKTGFPDVVVWNPGVEGVAAKDDFAPGDERRMLCVEAAAIGTPITLGAGAMWHGTQRFEAR